MSNTVLVASGNEVTDAARLAALAWPKTQQGGSTDGLTPPAGVAIWEPGTNLFRHGQCALQTDWNGALSGSVSSVDLTVPAPFSPQSIKYACDGTNVNQGATPGSGLAQAAVAGTLGVGSVWFKGVAGQSYFTLMRWIHTDASNASGTTTNFIATGAWQLVTPTSVAVGVGKTGDQLVLHCRINGTRAESFWVAHAMLQKGPSIVSPYVATSGGATAARAAARVQAPPALLAATQGWVALRVRMNYGSTQAGGIAGVGFSLSDGSVNNRISVVNGNGFWASRRVAGGAGGNVATANIAWAAGDVLTVILKWDAATIAISVNGGAFISAANANVPVVTALDIGSNQGAGNWLDSNIAWLATGTGTLSNADAVFLAGLTRQPTGLAELPGTATGYWAAVDLNYEARSPAAQADALCGIPICGNATCGMFWTTTYAGGEHLLTVLPDGANVTDMVPAAGLTLGTIVPALGQTDVLATPSAGLQLGAVLPTLRFSQTISISAAELALGAIAPQFVGQLWLHDEACIDLVLSPVACTTINLVPSYAVGGLLCGQFLCGTSTVGRGTFLKAVVPV